MRQGKYVSSRLLLEAANNRMDDLFPKRLLKHFFKQEEYKAAVEYWKNNGVKTPDYETKNKNGHTRWLCPQMVIHFAVWYGHPLVQRIIYKWYDYGKEKEKEESSEEEEEEESSEEEEEEEAAPDSDLNAVSEERTHKRKRGHGHKHRHRLSKGTDARSSKKKKRKHVVSNI